MKEKNKEKKKISKKTSKTFLIIGSILLAVGIAALIVSIIFLKQAENSWWGNPKADLPDPIFVFLSAVIIMIGITFFSIGLTPYKTKVGAKLAKETMDYAGEDLAKVGEKNAEIATPAIEKVTKTIVSSKDNVQKKIKCPYCGEEVDQDQAFCDECGKPLKKICPKCGKTNESDNKFCKYCGEKL